MKTHQGFVAAASTLCAVLLAAPSAATTFIYAVVAGGVDDGHACLSSAGSGLCAAEATFTVDAQFAVTGTVTHDTDTDTIDIELVALSLSMPGAHDGVTEVVFSDITYFVEDMSVLAAFPGQLFGDSAPGSVDGGTYSQLDGVSTVVGPDAFGPLTVTFGGISCSGLTGTGLCGLTVGGSRDFELDVGVTGDGDPSDFVHTLDFNVVLIPEPATASLLALGLMTLGLARRRR